jgi:hypothetical protein
MSATQVLSQQPELFHLPSELRDGEVPLTAPRAESRIASLVREFEADVAYAQQHLAENIRRNAKYLVPEEEQGTLPSRARAILDRYAVVDTLALCYRDRTRSTFIHLLAIAFFAMLVWELFAHILPEFFFPVGAWPRLIVWLYPVLWLGAHALWYHAHHRQYQKKYHDYRALAEGLRVQFFWNLLGLPDPIEEYYLRKQQGELEWIRRALRFWRECDEIALHDEEPTVQHRTAHKDLVRRLWVRDQLHFFARVAGPREKRRSDRCKRWGAILFGASLGLAVILGLCEVSHMVQGSEARPGAQAPPHPHWGLPHEESILVFAISMLLAGAAIAIAYGEKMAFAEHARQYGATSILFLNIDRRLSSGPPTTAEIDELRRLGKEALQENGDWLLLHRDRPLEVIVP